MANLSITSKCNLACRYCFAGKAFVGTKGHVGHMSRDCYERALDFLSRSRIDQVRLLGGEPTLHPDFQWMVARALESAFSVLVFSNGVISSKKANFLARQPEGRLSLLLNITSYMSDQNHIRQKRHHVMEMLGKRVTLGVNLSEPVVDLSYVLYLVERFGLSRTLRVGLAHPCIGFENEYLHPRHYDQVGAQLTDQALRLKADGITVDLDCGFVPCMFAEQDLSGLFKNSADIGQRCNPVLDILPSGNIIACYPLAGLEARELADDMTAEQLRADFKNRIEPYRSVGIFKKCGYCPHRRTMCCNGGCSAVIMHRYQQTPFAVMTDPDSISTLSQASKPSMARRPRQEASSGDDRQPQKGFADSLWSVPYIDQPLAFWEDLSEQFGSRIREVYLPLPDALIPSGRPRQPSIHQGALLAGSPIDLNLVINPVIFPGPVEAFKDSIVSYVGRAIQRGRVAGVTVANPRLGEFLREAFPELHLTASVLMDIRSPLQLEMLPDIFDSLVPASAIVRDLAALDRLRSAFTGEIKLLVNEGCLPGCPFRTQHFFEMGNDVPSPRSLCNRLLARKPWLRLTGAWILPQHLSFFTGRYDCLKLAGRVTLQDPEKYWRVLNAYLSASPLTPDDIGGGPASPIDPVQVDADFYQKTLVCDKNCRACGECEQYLSTSRKNRNR